MYKVTTLFLHGAMVLFILYPHEMKTTHFFYAHGLGSSKNEVLKFAKGAERSINIITGPYVSFDFSDVGPDGKQVIAKNVNLGQELDMKTLKAEYDWYAKSIVERGDTDQSIVAIGSSRGAATLLNVVSTSELPLLKAVVVLAPFNGLSKAVKHYLDHHYGVFASSLLHRIVLWYAQRFYYQAHVEEGISPEKVISSFNKNVPLLLVHSKNDDYIPVQSTRVLYLYLKNAGHKHVYLLELDSPLHGRYHHNSGDAERLEAVVHAFYKRYGITYDEKLALRGEEFLQLSQPDPNDCPL
jgi:predicted esterase